MKGLSLFFATSLTVVLTGVVLCKSGWLSSPRAAAVGRRCVEIGAQAPIQDASYREAAARWRRGQPAHWRMCLLQR